MRCRQRLGQAGRLFGIGAGQVLDDREPDPQLGLRVGAAPESSIFRRSGGVNDYKVHHQVFRVPPASPLQCCFQDRLDPNGGAIAIASAGFSGGGRGLKHGRAADRTAQNNTDLAVARLDESTMEPKSRVPGKQDHRSHSEAAQPANEPVAFVFVDVHSGLSASLHHLGACHRLPCAIDHPAANGAESVAKTISGSARGSGPSANQSPTTTSFPGAWSTMR